MKAVRAVSVSVRTMPSGGELLNSLTNPTCQSLLLILDKKELPKGLPEGILFRVDSQMHQWYETRCTIMAEGSPLHRLRFTIYRQSGKHRVVFDALPKLEAKTPAQKSAPTLATPAA